MHLITDNYSYHPRMVQSSFFDNIIGRASVKDLVRRALSTMDFVFQSFVQVISIFVFRCVSSQANIKPPSVNTILNWFLINNIHAFSFASVIFIIYVRLLRFSLFVDPIGILVFKARSPGKFRVISASKNNHYRSVSKLVSNILTDN